jgi:hypothetical protein
MVATLRARSARHPASRDLMLSRRDSHVLVLVEDSGSRRLPGCAVVGAAGEHSALKMVPRHARPRASDAHVVGWSGTCMAIRLMACVLV